MFYKITHLKNNVELDYTQQSRSNYRGLSNKLASDAPSPLQGLEAFWAQATALGYEPGDEIIFRLIPLSKGISDDERLRLKVAYRNSKGEVKPKRTIQGFITLGEEGQNFEAVIWDKYGNPVVKENGWGSLRWWNRQLYGVYLIPNPGGDT
ncbi:MAG: hypothetical protein AAGC93_31140, partial [Cyanobacteria bacterium P01_F01_bin.53]